MTDKSQGQKMKINQNVKMSMSYHKKKDGTSSLPPLKYECLEEMRLQVTRTERRDIPVKDRYRYGQQKSITSLMLFSYRQVRTPYPFDRSAVSFPFLESQKMHNKPSLKTYHLPPISDRQTNES